MTLTMVKPSRNVILAVFVVLLFTVVENSTSIEGSNTPQCSEGLLLAYPMKTTVVYTGEQMNQEKNYTCTWRLLSIHLNFWCVAVYELYVQPLNQTERSLTLSVSSASGEVYKTITGSFPERKHVYTDTTIPMAFICKWTRRATITFTAHGPGPFAGQIRLQLGIQSFKHRFPQKLTKNVYNCTGDSRFEVPGIAKCDLVPLCAGGEDEIGCDYNKGKCPEGWFVHDKSCNKIYTPPEPVSPAAAAGICEENKKDASRLHKLLSPQTLHTWDVLARVALLLDDDGVVVDASRVRTKMSGLSHLYRFHWQWGEYNDLGPRVIHGEPAAELDNVTFQCMVFRANNKGAYLQPVSCSVARNYSFVCSELLNVFEYAKAKLTFPGITENIPNKFPTKICKDQSFTHPFHPCPPPIRPAEERTTRGLPQYQCANGRQIHYTLTCDGYDDCNDRSDERPCGVMGFQMNYVTCTQNFELIPSVFECDGLADCHDNSDEEGCPKCSEGAIKCWHFGCVPENPVTRTICRPSNTDTWNLEPKRSIPFPLQPAYVTLTQNKNGLTTLTSRPPSSRCPETHFPCPSGLCVPVYMLNNGQRDCPPSHSATTDESYRLLLCPGYYRCYRFEICLHNDHLCDGVYQCPLKDDERYCDVPCPEGCSCEGFALTCHKTFDLKPHSFPKKTKSKNPPTGKKARHVFPYFTRYLDISGTAVPKNFVMDLKYMYNLQFLNLSSCGLEGGSFTTTETQFLYLRVLDVSHNSLTNISFMANWSLPRLNHLNLSHNPLALKLDLTFVQALAESQVNKLHSLSVVATGIRFISGNSLPDTLRILDISNNYIESIDKGAFANLKYLEILNMHGNMLSSISDGTFADLNSLQLLDISGNNILNFKDGMFVGLRTLKHLYTDTTILCCVFSYAYPASKAMCHAPADKLSSCSDLLRSNFLRGSLWTFSILAMVGNIVSLVYRVLFDMSTTSKSAGFRIMVTNLCVADFLMGVYLALIGSADAIYRGRYGFYINQWTNSATCKVAGLVGLISAEVSTFIIFFITLDRILVLFVPLHGKFHFNARSAIIACAVIWTFGVTLAVIPLVPGTGEWRFYSGTGICLPLPITARRFPGYNYSLSVFIVLNFVLFLLIGAGQLMIYFAVRSSRMGSKSQRDQEMTIARRLFLIAFSNFLCWFPIGTMGVLAALGTTIPSEVNVWAIIFALPLNAAVDPFLYTLNALLEKRHKELEEVRIQNKLETLNKEMRKWPKDKIQDVVHHAKRILKASRPTPAQLAEAEKEFLKLLKENIDLGEQVMKGKRFQKRDEKTKAFMVQTINKMKEMFQKAEKVSNAKRASTPDKSPSLTSDLPATGKSTSPDAIRTESSETARPETAAGKSVDNKSEDVVASSESTVESESKSSETSKSAQRPSNGSETGDGESNVSRECTDMNSSSSTGTSESTSGEWYVTPESRTARKKRDTSDKDKGRRGFSSAVKSVTTTVSDCSQDLCHVTWSQDESSDVKMREKEEKSRSTVTPDPAIAECSGLSELQRSTQTSNSSGNECKDLAEDAVAETCLAGGSHPPFKTSTPEPSLAECNGSRKLQDPFETSDDPESGGRYLTGEEEFQTGLSDTKVTPELSPASVMLEPIFAEYKNSLKLEHPSKMTDGPDTEGKDL